MRYKSRLTNCPCCGAIWQPTLPECAYCTFMPSAPEKLSKEDRAVLVWFARVLDRRLMARSFKMSLPVWKRITRVVVLFPAIWLCAGYLLALDMRAVSASLLLLALPFHVALLTSLEKWTRMRYIDVAFSEVGRDLTTDFLRGRNQSQRNLDAAVREAGKGQLYFIPQFLPPPAIKSEDKKERAKQIVEIVFRRLGRNCFLYTEPRKIALSMGILALVVGTGFPLLQKWANFSWSSAMLCLLPFSIWCCIEVSGKWYLMGRLVDLRPSLRYLKESIFAPLEAYAQASGQTIGEMLGSDPSYAMYERWWKKYGKVT